MITTHTSKAGVKSFYVRVGNGPSKAFSEKDYRTRSDAKHAAQQYELDLKRGVKLASLPTIDQYADRLLEHWANEVMPKSGRKRKTSTLAVHKQSLKPVRKQFGSKIVGQVGRNDARDWALTAPVNAIKIACQLYNRAADEFPEITYNPFKGLAPGTKGRAKHAPPTPQEFERLLESWSVHGPYAPTGQAFQTFAGHSGMRPGELYVLEWDDVDFDANRIHVRLRLWNGTTDIPKSNEERTIVLTKEAKWAIQDLPRTSPYVFVNKSGGRLSQPTLTGYWKEVRATAGLSYAFYHATKHFCCHRWFVVEGKSVNAIAQQMGWSRASTEAMLRIYGHGDIGWESEFEEKVVDLDEARQRRESA